MRIKKHSQTLDFIRLGPLGQLYLFIIVHTITPYNASLPHKHHNGIQYLRVSVRSQHYKAAAKRKQQRQQWQLSNRIEQCGNDFTSEFTCQHKVNPLYAPGLTKTERQ